jgi:addiction module HigA family antidote
MSKSVTNPIHPGEILREEFMKPLGISSNALALALRVPATRVSAIVNETRSISADTALRPGRYLSTTSEFWWISSAIMIYALRPDLWAPKSSALCNRGRRICTAGDLVTGTLVAALNADKTNSSS